MNVPSFLDSRVIKEDGTWTDEWKTIMQALFQNMQSNLGNEGLVMPMQSAANIATIQNNTVLVNGNTIYTCSYGTMIYNSSANTAQVALNNGSGVPMFKTITTS
jgi:hypothetical protein